MVCWGPLDVTGLACVKTHPCRRSWGLQKAEEARTGTLKGPVPSFTGW